MNDIHPSVRRGKNVTIRSFCYIGAGTVVGENVKIDNHCNIGKNCVIGDNCNLQYGTVLNDGTIVRQNTFFAGGVMTADEVYPTTGEQIRKPCNIGSNVVLGIKCTLVSCNIGDNAVVGAHSLVLKDIPAGEVWIGTPAKKLTTREEYDRKKQKWEGGLVQ